MPQIRGGQIKDESVESVDIKDGTIANSDISSTANIDFTKLGISDNYKIYTVTRTEPSVLNNYVEIGYVSGNTHLVKVTFACSSGFALTAKYHEIYAFYHSTTGWQQAIPVWDTGGTNGNTFTLDVNWDSQYGPLYLRIRADSIGGSAPNGDFKVIVEVYGGGTFTAQTGTGSASAPTTFYNNTFFSDRTSAKILTYDSSGNAQRLIMNGDIELYSNMVDGGITIQSAGTGTNTGVYISSTNDEIDLTGDTIDINSSNGFSINDDSGAYLTCDNSGIITYHGIGFATFDSTGYLQLIAGTGEVLLRNTTNTSDTAVLLDADAGGITIDGATDKSVIINTYGTGKLKLNCGWVNVNPQASEPASGAEGDIYVNSTTHKIHCYLDSSWVDLTGGGGGSTSMDGAYNEGSTVTVDDTTVDFQLADTKIFKISDTNSQDLFKINIDDSTKDVLISGDDQTFNTGGYATTPNVVFLDSTHIAVHYRDDGNSGYGTCIIGVISGGTITWGSEYTYNTSNTYNTVISKIDSTHFAIAYRDGSDGYRGKAAIATVANGDEISYGTIYTYNDASTGYPHIATLDSTHIIISFSDQGASSHGKAIIGTLSGSVITFGSEYTFNAGTSYDTVVDIIDSTTVVIGFVDSSNSSQGTAIIGNVANGDELTFGSEYIYHSSTTDNNFICVLDSTHFVAAYDYNTAGNDLGKCRIGTISGTTITYGDEQIFDPTGTLTYISCAKISSNRFIISYYDSESTFGSGRYSMRAVTGTVNNGDEITLGHNLQIDQTNASYIGVGVDSNGEQSAMVFRSSAGGSSGIARLLEIKSYGTATVKSNIIPNESQTCFLGKLGNEFADIYSHFGHFESTVFFGDGSGIPDYGAISFRTGGLKATHDIESNWGTLAIHQIQGGHTTLSSSSDYTLQLTSDTGIRVYGGEITLDASTYNSWNLSLISDERIMIKGGIIQNFSDDEVVLETNAIADIFVPLEPSTDANSGGDSYYTALAPLDETHVVLCFRDASDSNDGKAVIGTIANGNITWGTEYAFNTGTGTTSYVSVCKIDSTHFAVVYYGDFGYGNGVIGTVSNGDEISWGSTYQIQAATTNYTSVALLDSTHIVVTFIDGGNSNKGTAVIGTIANDDEITWGSEYIFNDASTSYPKCAVLDSTHFVVVYSDGGAGSDGHAIIGTVSGSTITYGTEYVFDSSSVQYPWVTALSSTKLFVGWRDSSADGMGRVGTVANGDEITFGTAVEFESVQSHSICCEKKETDKVGIFYNCGSGDNIGSWFIVASISGTTITYGAKFDVVGDTNRAYDTGMAFPTSEIVILSYRDYNDSYIGKTVYGYFPPEGVVAHKDILPIRNEEIDIGSSTKKFDNIYAKTGHFDSSTIYIGNVQIKTDNNILQFSADGKSFNSIRQEGGHRLLIYYGFICGDFK